MFHRYDVVAQCRTPSQQAFSDMHFVIDAMIAEGEQVVTRWTMRGTHRGEYLGITATGRQVTEIGESLDRIVEGKLVEGWVSSDDLGVLHQLGALTAHAS
jgi:predicted ester cyclase